MSFFNIFGYSKEVLSQRPADEVLLAISASTDHEKLRAITLFGSAGHRPIMSMMDKNHFRLHHRINYRNSFARDLHGVVEPTADGCRIRYDLRMPRLIQLFIVVWTVAVAYGALDSVVLYRIILSRGGTLDLWSLVPFALLVFGLVLMTVSRKRGKSNEIEMEEFVKRIAAGTPE